VHIFSVLVLESVKPHKHYNAEGMLFELCTGALLVRAKLRSRG